MKAQQMNKGMRLKLKKHNIRHWN